MVLENTFNETIDELPVTVEALNLPPIPANDYGSGIIILLDFEMWYFVTKIVLNYCEKKLF
jgi:hypothetical protein